MGTWSNQSRTPASWSNTSRNSAIWVGQAKSGAGMTFGDLNNDQIGAMTNDDIFLGRPLGEWKNDDPVGGTFWVNDQRH